jgi:hypothetical protein
MPGLDKLQIAQPQPANMLLQAMGMQDRMRRTDIAQDRNEIAREGMLQDQEEFEFRKMQVNLQNMKEFIPSLTREKYGDMLGYMESIGAGDVVRFLPSAEEMKKAPADKFRKWQMQFMLGIDGFRNMTLADHKSKLREYEEFQKQQNRMELESKKERAKVKAAEKKRQHDFALEEEKQKGKMATTRTASFDKNLLVASQAAGIEPGKVKSGTLSKSEAADVADKYRELFGTESLLNMLFKGAAPATQSEPTIKFDAEGNLIE